MGNKDATGGQGAKSAEGKNGKPIRLDRDRDYEQELRRLQIELVKLQEWIRHKGLRVVVILRGARRRRQGRRHQANYRYAQSPHLPRGRSRHADRERKNAVVFSALCGRIACRRRNGAV